MPTVIESLIVSLGLDPAKYVDGIAAAEAKTDKFSAALKRLGIDESKLDETQKAGLQTLRKTAIEEDQRRRRQQEAARAQAAAAKEQRGRDLQTRRETLEFQKKQREAEKAERDADKKKVQAQRELEVQSHRTRKELAAGFSQFKGFIEAGAATFGVALTVGAAMDYGLSTIRGLNTLSIQAAQAGVVPSEASALLQAMQGMGLPTEGALGTIQKMNAELNAPGMGNMPSLSLLRAAAILSGQGAGKVDLFDKSGRPLPPEQAILNFADPIKNIGQAKAAAWLGGILDPGLIAFLGKGRAADEAAIADARKTAPTSSDIAEAQKAAAELGKLSAAANAAGRALVMLGAPALLNGLIHLTGMLHYWLTGEDAGKYEREQKLKILGPSAVAEDDADAAMAALNQSYAAKAPPDEGTDWWTNITNWDAGPAPASSTPPNPLKRWAADQERARLLDLVSGGMSPADAAAQVQREEAKGGPPAATGVNPSEALLDAIRTVESHGDNKAVSPVGAQGPYQFMPDAWKKYGSGSPFDPTAARNAARKYLKDMFSRFHDWGLAEAAYNMNPDNLQADIDQAKTQYGKSWRSHLNEFIPPETAAYLPKIAGALGGAAAGSDGGSEVNIGTINITVPNGDPHTIAKGIRSAIVAQANSGPR